jgi:hypothetical protein
VLWSQIADKSTSMQYPRFKNNVGKACALAAALILPALAFAGNNQGQNNNNQGGNYPPITAVPEANAGIVLIPFVGAVLLFSARQLWRRKRAEKDGESLQPIAPKSQA